MKKLLRALKQWTLLIAIVVGAVGHSFFSQFTWLAPWLLASMLLLTFCNISPRDLRFHPLHLILMSQAASRGKSMVGPTRMNTLDMVSRKGVSICPVAMSGRTSGASTTMARLLRKA